MSLSPPPSDPPRAPPSLAPNDFLLTLRPPSAVHPPAPYTPTSNFCLITPSLLLVNVSREPKQAKEGAFSPSPLLRRSTKANEGLSPFPQPNPHRKRMRGREGGEESDACQDLLPARKALPLPCYCTGGGGGEGEEDACLSLVPQLQLPPPQIAFSGRPRPTWNYIGRFFKSSLYFGWKSSERCRMSSPRFRSAKLVLSAVAIDIFCPLFPPFPLSRRRRRFSLASGRSGHPDLLLSLSNCQCHGTNEEEEEERTLLLSRTYFLLN